ncbi:hypothetical protein [Myroides sp. LoEW2-1]|uniref:hypothetical protein n=1 Tax=Myroides sp. LoEW2-1 TaxID=2683192 RepID=UPI001320D135|nr:hypothetical protein [Myroides sp. LoEW2-1]MVX36212.1 hypothetical protein [Myroides sp. LoEW2-1]
MYNLSDHFKEFALTYKYNNKALQEIVAILISKDTSIAKLKTYLRENNIIIEQLKQEALDFLILYAYYTLKDDCITEAELNDFIALKRILAIKENDFIAYKEFQVKEILKQQFLRMYSDKFIDSNEAITQVNLQIMFGLSYDEFEELKQDEVINALLQGANPKDLDISSLPKGFVL